MISFQKPAAAALGHHGSFESARVQTARDRAARPHIRLSVFVQPAASRHHVVSAPDVLTGERADPAHHLILSEKLIPGRDPAHLADDAGADRAACRSRRRRHWADRGTHRRSWRGVELHRLSFEARVWVGQSWTDRRRRCIAVSVTSSSRRTELSTLAPGYITAGAGLQRAVLVELHPVAGAGSSMIAAAMVQEGPAPHRAFRSMHWCCALTAPRGSSLR
jgi:hypothetical protein